MSGRKRKYREEFKKLVNRITDREENGESVVILSSTDDDESEGIFIFFNSNFKKGLIVLPVRKSIFYSFLICRKLQKNHYMFE